MRHNNIGIIVALPCLVASLFFIQTPARAATVRLDNFVRSGNQYLVAGTDLKDELIPQLARYDLLVLPAEAQIFNPGVADRLRTINPNIVILAYVPTVSYNNKYWNDQLHLTLKNTLSPSMELQQPNGAQRSIWPSTSAYNIGNRAYRDAWLNYVETSVWDSDYWDGIFMDEVASSVSWMGDVDLDQNGQADSAAVADRAWKDGYVDLFSRARSALGPDAVLITNGSSEDAFQPYVNGRMFESFPTPWEGNGTWVDSMKNLLRNQTSNTNPDVFFLSSNTGGTGVIDYKQFRFGLTSALIAGAYYGYDMSESNYQQFWPFDEYETFLGRYIDPPKDILHPRSTAIQPSVWSRDFQAGKALVNSTDQPQTVQLGNEFEKINGSQDRSVNDGRIVTQVTIPPQDGVVLIRPVEELLGSQYLNGSFVRIFNTRGERKRTGFFTYTGATLGGDTIVEYDIDGDGNPEIISANNSKVRIHASNGVVLHEFYPYGPNYNQGINLAVGDLEKDGRVDIVTGTKNGGGPHIRIFNGDGVLTSPGFFAFHPLFRGGVNIALGDMDGDGRDEIIAGAGVGGGPQVQVFSKEGRLLSPGFFAYNENVRTGVSVAVGDVTGDGIADIVTGTGYGSAPMIRVFSSTGKQLLPEFAAFDVHERTGVPVAASDLDGDGVAEIIGLTTNVFTLSGNQQTYVRTAQK
ncbi:hypothetical protein COV06_02255 [Candidatus Uhrbacteria bacterium CG10_big_fil_rev_8_21_14_0_10_50_16]|uniref:Uncharacterized protein n=1 Tax=Candidatus Uhrbacteria bacterium CG10_big_fil_rev_8_21_14_0_10_50_16 TaxID=1975039 RepID=A0A2H0RNV8_9BACT|nr:MAG: hypothetical protein COV06_02255 [Candidatus Uhrbacteria bacterium CG10_big_fil_rev_8_21_14_0_10_50_16]